MANNFGYRLKNFQKHHGTLRSHTIIYNYIETVSRRANSSTINKYISPLIDTDLSVMRQVKHHTSMKEMGTHNTLFINM